MGTVRFLTTFWIALVLMIETCKMLSKPYRPHLSPLADNWILTL
jgi:hypothetical protein